LAVIAGGIGVYAALATGYNCFVEPMVKGHAVSRAIPEMVVEQMAPPAAPSAIIPSQGQALLPVAPEAAAAAPPTDTSAAEERKKLSRKQAVRNRAQPRNPLELALRPFSGLRLPF
jgi:hypothetical protein